MEMSPQHRMSPPGPGGAGAHDPDAMVREMRAPWLWTNATVIALGIWLVSSRWTFGYRSAATTWSDALSGVLLVVLAAAAFAPRFDFYGRWGAALVLWAPTAAAYLNDTLVGTLAIALSILVPMMPGMAHHMKMTEPGPEIPPGWTYCPSTWNQRAPIIALALIGWLISRYLAAYQLEYIATPAARINVIAAGLLLAALTLPRGPVRERYAAWDRFIR